jgi:hypothetical protein
MCDFYADHCGNRVGPMAMVDCLKEGKNLCEMLYVIIEMNYKENAHF